MKILGLNLTTTATGLALDDGNAALVVGGRAVIAVAEERLTRIKHSGGVARAVQYCLSNAQLRMADVDAVAVSICCDVPPSAEAARSMLEAAGVEVGLTEVVVCPSHHLAHAASAFYCSPFDEAVVVVADDEGNILGERQYPEYWRNQLERTTVWQGSGASLRLLSSHGDGEAELSLGAAYHYVTRWLGLNSYHEAGQTMALAAFAANPWPDRSFFRWEDDRLVCDLEPLHTNKGEAVRRWVLQNVGEDVGPGFDSCWEPGPEQLRMASFIQASFESALVSLVQRSLDQSGLSDVCLAGGTALNCVANTKVLRESGARSLFVTPAASDVGQGLGAALWLSFARSPKQERTVLTSPFLGATDTRSNDEIVAMARSRGLQAAVVDDAARTAAELLEDGNVIGWFQGRSEVGPRALGHRSVLADPRNRETKGRLDNVIKRRATYRPYAPAVLAEEANAWFEMPDHWDTSGASPSAFMLLAVPVRAERQELVPAIVHVDGTARVQTLDSATESNLRSVIERFFAQTGVPIVLNTSFNAAGDAMVESIEDALDAFCKMRLDAMVIHDVLVQLPPLDNAER